MPTLTTHDGIEIFYKDWGSGQPIVFHHGWPLSSDEWDAQMLFFVEQGFRVVAHDRRGHGRSAQVWDGHDMDHYADDLAALTAHLDLKNAVHIGHSTGGGEVAHYLARHGESRAAKAVLISAVPPLMMKTKSNPGGLPKEVFDGLQAQLAGNRAQFYRDLPAGPFYGFNRPGVTPQEGVIQNWWRQGMMGGAKAHYDGIVAFSQTDFTNDLKKIGSMTKTKFAVNVEMWFTQLPFLERIRKAAELGFPAIEMWPFQGRDLDAIGALTQELGIRDRVLRRTYMATPATFYRVVDGFILTSRYEGFSLAALEALSADLPMILSDAPGITDLLARSLSHVWKAAPGDVDGFARGITAWRDRVSELFPQAAKTAKRVAEAVKILSGGQERAVVKVNIRQGTVYLGLFPVAEIPPL